MFASRRYVSARGEGERSEHALEFLAEAALILGNHALTRHEIGGTVARMLRDHLGSGYVVFSSYLPDQRALQVQCIAGAGDHLTEAIRQFQSWCPGGLLPLPPDFPWRSVALPVIMPMAGGITEMTFGAVDAEKAHLLQTRLGIAHCWLLCLGRGSRLLGTLAMLLGPEDPAPDHRVVETFGTLVTLTLLARRAMDLGSVTSATSRDAPDPVKASPAELARKIVEDQVEAICRYDPTGRLLFVNASFARLFGRSPEELLGQPAMELVHRRDRPRRRRHLARLSPEAPTAEIEHRVIRADGSVAWIHWADRAIFDHDGRVTEYQSVGRDVTLRRQAEQRMAWLATHDPLTGLPNRVLLKDRLTGMIHRSGRSGRPFALALLDLDGFKEVNDRLGHRAGDAVLRRLGAMLSRAFRRSDTVARLGGDEFVVLVGDCGDGEPDPPWLRKLRESLTTPIELEDPRTVVVLGASIGVVKARGYEVDPETLLAQADRAMYAAKKAGKGCAVFFHEGLGEDDEEGTVP